MSQVFNRLKFKNRAKKPDNSDKSDGKEIVERMNESIRLHDAGIAFGLPEDFQQDYVKRQKEILKSDCPSLENKRRWRLQSVDKTLIFFYVLLITLIYFF